MGSSSSWYHDGGSGPGSLRTLITSRNLVVAISLASLLTLFALFSTVADISSLSFTRLSRPFARTPITYLPFTYGHAALLQSLDGYERAGWKNIIVVDNSPEHNMWSDRHEIIQSHKSVKDIVTTPVHLHFAQLQAYMDHLAWEDGAEVYLWGHTDVILLSNGSGISPYDAMLESLDYARGQKLGVIFFNYDLLSAVFTHPASLAPWDPNMPQYGSDCDRYHRVRQAGFRVEECPTKIGEIVHMHAVLSVEERGELWSKESVKEQLDLLERVNRGSSNYKWREETERDKVTREAAEKGGKEYEYKKWGVEIIAQTCEHLGDYTAKW